METKNKSHDLQIIKHNLFKTQNPEIGRFNVIFEVEGKILYAHQNMLDLVSDTFDSMLSERWTKKNEPIKIKDYSYHDFYQFLIFLYSGECQLTDENIFKMVDISEFYGVTPFKTYCDEYLAAMEITTENIFLLIDSVDKYSMAQLKDSVLFFIASNFQSFADSNELFNVNKNIFKEIFTSVKDKLKTELLFQAVYNWSEKQAKNKQSFDPSLNLNDSIKAEIADFLPNIRFSEMDLDFLHEFVVPKGFIFTSFDELSKILCERKLRKKVKITNENGQTLHGFVILDESLIKNIESLKFSARYLDFDKCCFWNTQFNRPSTPSFLKKREGIEFYLYYYPCGRIGVEHCSFLNESNYLLAELTPGPSGFQMKSFCKIEIE